ncbi:MAG: SDR family oxidoreductase [Flavobacteriaceae bacterium]|jgi:NAD(P)-dependent dehydrogenase (short-subunit alcohol dehydrogenase family)|nr:SDR family oxidoreductase [Flavobacteriaceae bacterium]
MYAGIENKVILLVGAGGLIGKEVLLHLVKNGAKVVAVDLKRFESEADLFIEANVTEKDGIDYIVSTVIDKYGQIDGLVNLAYPRTSDWGRKFEDIEFESWQQNVDMQLNAVFYLCQQVLKIMRQQQYGSIVNIGSIYGVVGNDFSLYQEYGGTSPAAYTAIKGGIINFTKYLASYYGEYGVRVNCMSPGGVLDKKNQHNSFIARYSEKSPLKRLGNPEEMAPAVTFLLSDDASFITGHNLMVDGGWTII